MPIAHGIVVVAAGIGVTHSLNDGQASLPVEPIEGCHFRMESELGINLVDLISGQAQGWAVPMILIVLERDERVQAVVAAT
jgi:hypothetical protein